MSENIKGLVALLGDPVAHSLSPAMHNAAFAHMNINMNYMAFRVSAEQFPEALKGLAALGAVGANITVPHKEAAFRLVDTITPSAEAAGSVNTVLFKADGMEGHNTDIFGVRKAVSELSPRKTRATVLGAGGAARAVVCALAEEGFQVVRVMNRSLARAEKFKTDLALLPGNTEIQILSWGHFPDEKTDLLVNATSLGLDTNPWPDGSVEEILHDSKTKTLLDLVYSSEGETSLVHEASRMGISALGGESVLLHQGVAAFELFTGKTAPVDVMRQALIKGRKRS